MNIPNLDSKDMTKAITGMGKEGNGSQKYGGFIENIIPGGGGRAARSAFEKGYKDPVEKADWPGKK